MEKGDRLAMMTGCWVAEVWRLSDVVTLDGRLIAGLSGMEREVERTEGGTGERKWTGLGGHWGGLVRKAAARALKQKGGMLGERLRGSIRLGAFVWAPTTMEESGAWGWNL